MMLSEIKRMVVTTLSIYEEIELQDCPYCSGPGLLEEESGTWYVVCADCGARTANHDGENAARESANFWNIGKVIKGNYGE